MKQLNAQEFYNSYCGLKNADLTDDMRTKLWEQGQILFPEISNALQHQYLEIGDDRQQEYQAAGATFLFLALVNSLQDYPIISTTLDDEASPARHSFPRFGYLRSLS